MTSKGITKKSISIDPDSWKVGKPPSPEIDVLNPHGTSMTRAAIMRKTKDHLMGALFYLNLLVLVLCPILIIYAIFMALRIMVAS
jgi:hypothetical protein